MRRICSSNPLPASLCSLHGSRTNSQGAAGRCADHDLGLRVVGRSSPAAGWDNARTSMSVVRYAEVFAHRPHRGALPQRCALHRARLHLRLRVTTFGIDTTSLWRGSARRHRLVLPCRARSATSRRQHAGAVGPSISLIHRDRQRRRQRLRKTFSSPISMATTTPLIIPTQAVARCARRAHDTARVELTFHRRPYDIGAPSPRGQHTSATTRPSGADIVVAASARNYSWPPSGVSRRERDGCSLRLNRTVRRFRCRPLSQCAAPDMASIGALTPR